MSLSLEDFVADQATAKSIKIASNSRYTLSDLIGGVQIIPLSEGKDKRGELHELLTTRNGLDEPIVHVYQVTAEAGTVRAWVYHKNQSDRLAFTNGIFAVVLYDLRPESATYGRLNTFTIGENLKCLLVIPPYVIHGVKNQGSSAASFINMPTQVYNPEQPDKWRLPVNHPDIPYTFDN